MTNNPFCIAADWGTSNLRLWLMAENGAVLRELRSEEGLTRVVDGDFTSVLERSAATLGASADLPVIICGMAGSRQGWKEAPYVDTPASLDDVVKNAVNIAHANRDVRILPGIAQRSLDNPDVMRGEETQLLGLPADGAERTIVMPGTHSKWVRLEGRSLALFKTFMTGELFHLFSTASLLRHSMDEASRTLADDPHFLRSCQAMIDEPGLITAQLFSIRAGSLLYGASPSQAKAALSGILIGAEIGTARKLFAPKDVVLVGTGGLGALYETALGLAGISVSVVDAERICRGGLLSAAKALWPA